VLHEAKDTTERLLRGVFAPCVCLPLRGAKRLRVTRDAIEVDQGEGWKTAWSLTREGAARIEAG
jgi:hypothetical protein